MSRIIPHTLLYHGLFTPIQFGLKNNLLELIIEDGSFGITEDDISRIMNPELYIGRAPQQVEEYITNVVNPMLDANKELLTIGQVDLKV